MVSTLDSEPSDPSSNLGRTSRIVLLGRKGFFTSICHSWIRDNVAMFSGQKMLDYCPMPTFGRKDKQTSFSGCMRPDAVPGKGGEAKQDFGKGRFWGWAEDFVECD